MIIALKNKTDLQKKLISILDTAKLKGTNNIVIMTQRSWHMEVFDFFRQHKGIGRIILGGSTFFIIKEMRVELKPIDYYV